MTENDVLEVLARSSTGIFNDVSSPLQTVQRAMPRMSEAEIRSVFAYWERCGFLQYALFTDGSYSPFRVHETALAYLIRQREQDEADKAAKMSEHRWELMYRAVSFAFGLISGAILMWLKDCWLK